MPEEAPATSARGPYSCTKAYPLNPGEALHVDAISVGKAIDEALTALHENKPTTITRTDLAAQYEGPSTASGETIKARPAASQPAH